MTIGFIGLGKMGLPMASRLLGAGYDVTVFDTDAASADHAAALGAVLLSSPRAVADTAETVFASLPSSQASWQVATGVDGVIEGTQVKRFLDMSTIGAEMAARISERMAERGIFALDCPVSGGVTGAQKGTLAIMVSGPRRQFDVVTVILDILGKPIFVDEKSGAAQTMKLVNNLMAAVALASTAEVMVMGVKAGLDASVMIDVLNAGSGATHASRDKFPRAVLPRTFDYGFATGLMVKDVRLYLQEAESLGVPAHIAEAVAQVWEATVSLQGPDSDFTTVVRPMEEAAGVVVADRRLGVR
jgi:3-hydroxyisobutyrate dehydrogenase-like beta-hydroxyacid dehydrogenase